MSVQWIFDPSPPSGARSGGNAAEYSFEGRIDSLVREVIQNSQDARVSVNSPVVVSFRVIELTRDHLEQFLTAIGWSSLQDNLRAVPDKRGGLVFSTAIKNLEETQKLRILVIEDSGTRGLEGAEHRTSDEERNPFCALVKDEMYSDKADANAGGSFGLGKSVLWAYSNLKTVIFASIPKVPPTDKDGVRFIGRTYLPYHETAKDGKCTGDGWLGIKHATQAGRYSESVWGPKATELARRCSCARAAGSHGLSIAIVGLGEPGEEDRSSHELAASIIEAALESFWPAIARGQLRVAARVEDNDVAGPTLTADPEKHGEGYSALVDLLEQFDSRTITEKEKLQAGESALRWVNLDVPKRLVADTHPADQTRVALLVRLLPNEDKFKNVQDRVFRFRHPGMVIRAQKGRNLSINARPYIAIVVAGQAVSDSQPDARAELFLRAAEPPAHDCWTHNTRSIKQSYQLHGCKTMLDRFEKAILDAIRELVSQPEEKGGALPRQLLKFLRFGAEGGGGNPQFLSVTSPTASIVDGRWTFSANCRRVRPDEQPWHIRVKFNYAVDGGSSEDVHAISKVTCSGASSQKIQNGVAFVEVPGSVAEVRLDGETDATALPILGARAAVQLKIEGSKGGIP